LSQSGWFAVSAPLPDDRRADRGIRVSVADADIEFSGPGEEIRAELGEGLAEFADAGRGELTAVLVRTR
jgi:hypothetical protein